MQARRAALMCISMSLALLLTEKASAAALGDAFTYQGTILSGGVPTQGTCDLSFGLFDATSGGAALGAQQLTAVEVSRGQFTVRLNEASQFGASAFNGQERWMQLAVRCPSGSGAFVTLAPRQPVRAEPLALYSKKAPWSGLAGVPSGLADGIDNDTTYTAGSGLALVGGQFSVSFGGTGSATTAARSDHDHGVQTFGTIQTPAGTSPVADSLTDVLQLSSSDDTIRIQGSDTGGADVVDLQLQTTQRAIFVPAWQVYPYSVVVFSSTYETASLEFPGTGESEGTFSLGVPVDWVGNENLSIEIVWSGDTAPTGNRTVVWTVVYRPMNPGDVINETMGQVAIASTTISAFYTPYRLLSSGTGLQHSVIAGKSLLLMALRRDAAAPGDTYTGKALLHGVWIRYTARR